MPSSNACWGIEVGAGSIKALKVERDGDVLRVADFAVVPHKKVLSTPDINRDDAIAVALGAFMSQYRDALRGSSIAVSIPGHSAFARFAKLPPVEKKGVENLVRFEAVQQIPFPIQDVEWDFQTFASDDSPDIEVGIFAVTKAKMTEVLAQYGDQALVPDIVTLSPVAVYNAIAYDLSFTAKTPGTVILDIGTTASDLIIAEGGKVWVRTFPLGGHNFTEALASTFKLTYGKAEKLKREAETSKYKRHIFQALKPVLQELVQDVQRSIGYYRDTHPDAQISRLIGVGSTFKLIGLRKLLSQQLKIDVFRYEHAKRLNVEGAAASDFESATSTMATAYGLALQGLGLQTIDANLMPVSVIRQALWKRKTPWFVTAACIGLAGGALSFARPLLDSMAVAAAKRDTQNTSPIQQAISTGNRLKQKWTEVSGIKQPGLVAENLRRLAEGRELYPLFLSDLGAMFESATTYAKEKHAGLEPAQAQLRLFTTEYVAPGGNIASKGASSAGRDERGGGGEGGEAAAPTTAGQAGAVRFTLEFDSPIDSRPYANDSFLAWLRSNAQRAGVPYSYVGIPQAAEITTRQISGPTPTPRDSTTPPSDGSTGDAPETPPEVPPPPPTRDRESRGGRQPSAPPKTPVPDAKSLEELNKLAPLPASSFAPPAGVAMYRYTITWAAQIKTAAELAAELKPASPEGEEKTQ